MAKFLSRSDDNSRQVVDPYCVKQPLYTPSSSKSHGRGAALAFAATFVATRRPSLTRFLLPVIRSVLQARHVSWCAQHERAGRKIGVKKGLVIPWPRRAKHSLGRLYHAGSTLGSIGMLSSGLGSASTYGQVCLQRPGPLWRCRRKAERRAGTTRHCTCGASESTPSSP